MSPRPRRLFLALLALPVLFLFLLFLISRPAVSSLFSTAARPSELPDEIFGLLHFVTSPDEAGRLVGPAKDSTAPEADGAGVVALQNGVQLGGAVVPEKPVEMTWYALGSIARAGQRGRGMRVVASSGWEGRLRALRERYPLVVFSKSYCPYSKRAKRLLDSYELSPAPKIIEVDLRADSSHIKTLLTRLTHRSTFPNVILHGRSLGGSDELVRLHEEDRLRQVLERAGLKVGWTGEGGEGELL